MKTYNFDETVVRRGTNSYKWDTPQSDDILPMWVADMDFRTAPCIIKALKSRVEHGVFGYTRVPDEYYQAVVGWFANRHGWSIDPGHIIYTSGVVPAVSAIIKALTRPGEKVIVQTPAYNCFFSSIRNNGCILSANNLLVDAEGRYSIDFEDLERRAAEPEATLMLLCNPHNPSGRVWTREELERIDQICSTHGVTVVADEIHCEFTYQGEGYVPYATVADPRKTVVCTSPSKAFNIAGLQIANIVATDEEMRRRIDRAINDNEVCDVNPFGVVGLIAAYTEGGQWLDALRQYLWENYLYARRFIHENLPFLKATPLEGTYLLWIDCSALDKSSEEVCELLLHEGRLMLSPGHIYGPGGEHHVRLNLACPRTVLSDGLQRMKQVLVTTTTK